MRCGEMWGDEHEEGLWGGGHARLSNDGGQGLWARCGKARLWLRKARPWLWKVRPWLWKARPWLWKARPWLWKARFGGTRDLAQQTEGAV